MRLMPDSNRSVKESLKESFNETEAAAALGISVGRLHQLLDMHIFTAGNKRPASLEFSRSDLLLLSYWQSDSSSAPRNQVIPMPKRK